jgi:hypothetical protein
MTSCWHDYLHYPTYTHSLRGSTQVEHSLITDDKEHVKCIVIFQSFVKASHPFHLVLFWDGLHAVRFEVKILMQYSPNCGRWNSWVITCSWGWIIWTSNKLLFTHWWWLDRFLTIPCTPSIHEVVVLHLIDSFVGRPVLKVLQNWLWTVVTDFDLWNQRWH